MEVINLAQKVELINEYWDPKIIAELNGQHVKIAKIKGQFLWHSHENEDELFYVLSGELVMHFRDKVLKLSKGDMCVVPKGIEHKPVAIEETYILMFEPIGTLNTGDKETEKTQRDLEHI